MPGSGIQSHNEFRLLKFIINIENVRQKQFADFVNCSVDVKHLIIDHSAINEKVQRFRYRRKREKKVGYLVLVDPKLTWKLCETV